MTGRAPWSTGVYVNGQPAGPARAGFSLKVPVAEAGRYALRFTAALTSKSGKFSASFDGKPILGGDDPVDLFVPYRTLLRTFSSPTLELSQGEHQIKLRYEGGPDGVSEPEIGLDFLWVQKR